ncbi:MAG TPA: tryptophan--tRNA ligase [Caldisericia bacterium]|nr:tryptophan--tRNA ligase [Caldisericia bacterium]HPF48382.1 tryptophan--tRNA ligase [Caldisericia bacterium]HPI83439.1 tryptophan--tRNA ligase [Caldisericia bacterium]HPQ92836.1 tryptophan--tRNA ligase [Caldisericia bacterium]HRV74067.1 tryptophan--tRNA ligase [Caldisericia bacterium]
MARIVSGMRCTGQMNIAHYLSVLQSYKEMQEKHECFFFLADLHALTTNAEKSTEIKSLTLDIATDWLASGISPEKATIFIQSQIPAHYKLYLMLSMITPTGWLERNPTVKDMIRDYNLADSVGHGLLGYPVLQAADIIIYKGEMVPIGKDQRPHLEITREIVRRFNSMYGETFPEPQEYLREYPLIKGVDGKKMSKSLDNAILLTDDEKTIGQRVSRMVTDPAKVRRDDPGHPDVCSVYEFHQILKTPDLDARAQGCKSGELGCVACKKELASELDGIIAPIREKRKELVENPKQLRDVLEVGKMKAIEESEKVWGEVMEKMGFMYG